MCSICGQTPCHPRCPNYKSPDSDRVCDKCGYPILNGEMYVENDKGESMHYECFDGVKDVLEWLGYPIVEENDGTY